MTTLLSYVLFFTILQIAFTYPRPQESLLPLDSLLADENYLNYIQPIDYSNIQSLLSEDGPSDLSSLQYAIHSRSIRATIDPEATMTVEEIIRYHGYPVETHYVTTADGYILTIQRIPHGESGPGSKPRKPVVVQHGVLCSSASWVSDVKDKNLPYIIADAGYDVWLGNVRGTLFGRNHTRLSPKNSEFWDYSFDEMGKYDIPAIIDYILKKTGQKQIQYVGHSMGTTMAFILLSTQPKYNNIIRTVFALAPVATVGNMRSPVRLLAPLTEKTGFILELFGNGEFLSNSKLIKFFSKTVCASPVRILCSSILFTICGFDLEQLNQTRLPVYLHHTPAATSVQNMVHFSQMVRTGNFQYHDFGTRKNLLVYGQETAPLYDVKKITTQVALMWGENDWVADPSDVSKLAQKLPNLILKYRVPFDKFSHMDFLWAIDVKTLVYDKLMSLMRETWED